MVGVVVVSGCGAGEATNGTETSCTEFRSADDEGRNSVVSRILEDHRGTSPSAGEVEQTAHQALNFCHSVEAQDQSKLSDFFTMFGYPPLTLPRADAERGVRDAMRDQHGLDGTTVDCYSDKTVIEGHDFACTAKANGQTFVARGVFTDDEGAYEVDPPPSYVTRAK